MHGLVGHRDMARAAVGVGEDRDGLDAEPPRRLDDPAGDLAAIGDQDLGEHQTRPLRLALVEERPHAFERLLGDALVGDMLAQDVGGTESCGSASIWVTSFLISVWTEGAPSFSSPASVATVASSSSASTTWSTRPMR